MSVDGGLIGCLRESGGRRVIKQALGGKMQQQLTWRGREEVARFFEGTNLVEPGLVRIEEWRPQTAASDGHKSPGWAAVARKR